MTEQRPRLLIAQCKLQLGTEIKLEYLLKDNSFDSVTFYCDNALQNERGICCSKNGSEPCPVYLGMIERLALTATTTKNKYN